MQLCSRILQWQHKSASCAVIQLCHEEEIIPSDAFIAKWTLTLELFQVLLMCCHMSAGLIGLQPHSVAKPPQKGTTFTSLSFGSLHLGVHFEPAQERRHSFKEQTG